MSEWQCVEKEENYVSMTFCCVEIDVTTSPSNVATQQTREIHPMLDQCCASVADSGPALNQQLIDVMRGTFLINYK